MGEIKIDRQKRNVSYESNGYRLIFKSNELQIVNRRNEIYNYEINEIADLFTVQNQLLEEWITEGYKLKVKDLEFFKVVREMIEI